MDGPPNRKEMPWILYIYIIYTFLWNQNTFIHPNVKCRARTISAKLWALSPVEVNVAHPVDPAASMFITSCVHAFTILISITSNFLAPAKARRRVLKTPHTRVMRTSSWPKTEITSALVSTVLPVSRPFLLPLIGSAQAQQHPHHFHGYNCFCSVRPKWLLNTGDKS